MARPALSLGRFLYLGILVLLLSVGSCTFSEPQAALGDSGLSQDGLGRLCFNQIPFSGSIVSHYPDGKLHTYTPYAAGRLEGTSLIYYPSGQLRSIRYFEKGEKEGLHKGFYSDGSPQFRYLFEGGKSVGTHLNWYENGQLAQEMNYVDGKEFGAQKVWRQDGKLRSNYVVREDGRRYGLVGIKRCKNIDTEAERIAPLTATTYAE